MSSSAEALPPREAMTAMKETSKREREESLVNEDLTMEDLEGFESDDSRTIALESLARTPASIHHVVSSTKSTPTKVNNQVIPKAVSYFWHNGITA